MAWFRQGETLGRILVKVRAGQVSSVYGGHHTLLKPGKPGRDTRRYVIAEQ